MRDRRQRTAVNPTVEASQAELAVIEAAKNTSQGEVLSLAANKKQLEADFEVAKQKLDAELALKREQFNVEILLLEGSLATKKAEIEIATKKSIEVTEETKQLETTRNTVQKQLTESNEKLSAANTEVTRLMVLQHNLNDSIKDARTDYKDAETKLVASNKDLADILVTVKSATENNATIVNNIFNNNDTYKKLLYAKQEVEETLSKLDKELQTKIDQKAALDADLIEVQKQVSQHKQDMATLDAESATRAGNASRLEVHVDGKLKHLKALEKEYTTEHLARGGYTKTG